MHLNTPPSVTVSPETNAKFPSISILSELPINFNQPPYMRNKLFVMIPLVIGIIFSACNRTIVNLDYTNAKGDIPQLSNLIFRFDKALVKDSLLNQWDSTQYIEFEPKIPGRFRWEHPDELVFSPSRPLPPATTFKAKFKDDLLQFTEYDKLGNTDKIQFSTPELHLDNSNVTWILQDDRSTSAVPQVDLYFNYAVNPAAIKDKLKLEVAGKPVDYNVQTLSNDNKLSLRIIGLKPEDKDLESRLVIEKGLVPEGGVNGTKENIESKVSIPSPFNLSVNDVSAEHNGTSGTVFIRTSQQLIMNNISSYVQFNPAVKFNIEQTDDGFALTSDDFDVSKTYLLTLNKGLRGRIGGVLREQYDNNVAFGELEPSVSFGSTKAVYLAAKGSENIELRITNIPKVKIIISKIYESNLLTAQRYGYYPRDSQGEG